MSDKNNSGLEVVAWLTNEKKDGKQTLGEPCMATNPAYVEVHKEWNWHPLVSLSDAEAALARLAKCEEAFRREENRADLAERDAEALNAELVEALTGAANYIDTLGGDSKRYRAALLKAEGAKS